jgi:hypothetical protein
MLLNFDIRTKEMGGIPLPVWENPVVLMTGTHCKLSMLVKNYNGYPFNSQLFTFKFKIKKQDDSILEIIPTVIDFANGLWEIEITPVMIADMKIVLLQDVEIEVIVAASPTIKSFHSIKKLVSVTEPMFG